MTATAVRSSRPRTRSRVSLKWPLWVALALSLAAILGFGGVYSYVWAPVDVLLFAAVIALVWIRLLSGRSLLFHPMLWPMLGFGLLVAAQWALRLSVYPGQTLTEFIQLAGCGAAFYLAVQGCRSPQRLARLGWVLWLFCGVLALEAILQAFGANDYIYWFHDATYATPIGPFVYHNLFAGCMDLLLPMAAVVALRVGRPTPDPVWIVWLRKGLVPALAFAAVVISRSRGGILVLAAEALIGGWVFWPDLKRHRRALLAGAGALLGFSFLANWGPMVRRFNFLASHDASVTERVRMAASCWRIFEAHRWFGAGFGTFATVYPAFQTFDNGLSVLYAHNDFAQMLAETGIAGAICALAFLLLWGRAFWRCRQDRNSPHAARALQLAAFVGTAGFILHSWGDFQFHAPGNALLFFLLIAVAVAPISRPNKRETA